VFGLQPYPDLRQALTIFLPAALTVVTQWLVLRAVLGRPRDLEAAVPRKTEAPAEEPSTPPEPPQPSAGMPPFPTE
jgi:hypothetical protein